MEELLHKFRILLSAERTLAKLNGRRWASQVVAYATAILLGMVAVVFMNFALFDALAERHGNVTAASAMAALDAVLAVGIALWAGRQQPGTEEALVREIQDMVLKQIEHDVKDVGQDITAIRSALTGSGGLASIAGLMPIITVAVDLLKHHRSD